MNVYTHTHHHLEYRVRKILCVFNLILYYCRDELHGSKEIVKIFIRLTKISISSFHFLFIKDSLKKVALYTSKHIYNHSERKCVWEREGWIERATLKDVPPFSDLCPLPICHFFNNTEVSEGWREKLLGESTHGWL